MLRRLIRFTFLLNNMVIIKWTLIGVTLILYGCDPVAQHAKDRLEFEQLVRVIRKGDTQAKHALEDYLRKYRDRSVGNPFAEVEESPFAKEARSIYERAAHKNRLDQRWFDSWSQYWTFGRNKGVKVFTQFLKDYKNHHLGNVYESELKRILRELEKGLTPAQWSPGDVRWLGIRRIQEHSQPVVDEVKKVTDLPQLLCVAQHEVTVHQYRICVDAGVCSKPDQGSGCTWKSAGGENLPVNCVDWHQAKRYAEWIGGHLPSKSEWKFIYSSGKKEWPYPWGDEKPRCAHGAFKGNEEQCVTHGPRPPCRSSDGLSIQGVCDLAGNLQEWLNCDDAQCSTVKRNYIGGSWRTEVYRYQAAQMHTALVSYRYYDVGFRPVKACTTSTSVDQK